VELVSLARGAGAGAGALAGAAGAAAAVDNPEVAKFTLHVSENIKFKETRGKEYTTC